MQVFFELERVAGDLELVLKPRVASQVHTDGLDC